MSSYCSAMAWVKDLTKDMAPQPLPSTTSRVLWVVPWGGAVAVGVAM